MNSPASLSHADLIRLAGVAGFLCRGGFHPDRDDGVPGVANDGSATLILLGNAGPSMWRAFTAAGGPRAFGADPLDAWTRETATTLARNLGAAALFPFGGPPYLPFQAWGKKAEGLSNSPLGILIHPEYGLWHAYRAALTFERKIELPLRTEAKNPCARCNAKPCLKGCPVDAFAKGAYNIPACVRYLDDPLGAVCLNFGCLARHACPVGQDYAPEPAQAHFHMEAFLRANRQKG